MLTGGAGSVNSARAGGCHICQPPALARGSDTGLLRSDLETELHRHLNLSRRRAEEQARNHACARVAYGGAGRGELGMIERVEELEFELVLEAFAEASHLDERKVYVRLSRRAQDVAPGVAVGPRVVRRHHERVQIEPAINSRIVELARRDLVRAVARAGGEQVLRLVDAERQPRTQQENPAQLPAADQLVGQRIDAAAD